MRRRTCRPRLSNACVADVRCGATHRRPRADRKLAKRTHPDKTADDRAGVAFDALRDAYELLADPKRRAEHDAKLAREDVAAKQRRLRQRDAAVRATLRTLGATARVAWANKRATLGVVVLVYLRFFL